MLETNTREPSSVAQRIIYEGISKEDDNLKMDLRKEILSDVKQSWRFAKAAEAENKERQTAGENRWKKERELIIFNNNKK